MEKNFGCDHKTKSQTIKKSKLMPDDLFSEDDYEKML